MFLLPVLERVGFAKWAAERGTGEPEPDVLAAQIFHLLLSRLRVDEEDPAWALARQPSGPSTGSGAVPSSSQGPA